MASPLSTSPSSSTSRPSMVSSPSKPSSPSSHSPPSSPSSLCVSDASVHAPENCQYATKHRFNLKNSSIEQMQAVFNIGGDIPRDVVLVSLDLEVGMDANIGAAFGEQLDWIHQIGASYLDTRNLTPPYPAVYHLTTRHIIIGGYKRFAHRRKEYHFGNSEHLNSQEGVNQTISELLHIPDEKSSGRFRNIVLVGHGLASDFATCRRRGIVIEDTKTIVGVVDTAYLTKEVLGMGSSLASLLNILNCPHGYLHNAGNDANSALRALFLLCYYGLHPHPSDHVGILDHLKALAMNPLPDITARNFQLLASKLESRCTEFVLDSLDIGGVTLFHDD
ncbi:hypothetical protein VTL71DRAFT_2877 [Oculimacula yallundae]|uniref:Gfd2/YDR514C-like C-terminal domain-containing protein n=1 Tax=Oculimacula yallundae TaxID=86028 RepID=A0ABR4C5I6_9HELO